MTIQEAAGAKSDGEKIMDLVKTETGGDAPKKWFPVGKTIHEWGLSLGEGQFAVHAGTLLCFEGGAVWMCGLIGMAFAGLKKTDGTVLYAPTMLRPEMPAYGTAVVVEAADSDYGEKCYRLESGAIHCECSEDW